MKKIICSILAVAVVIAACKKERSGNASDTKTQEVTFKVGFAQTSTGYLGTTHTNKLATNTLATNADTALTNHIQLIYYMVFDAAGKTVHVVTQKATDPSFGKYADNLKSGQYTVVIAASSLRLKVEGTDLATRKLSDFRDETFVSKFTLNVATTAIVNNVSLQRITSKLIVNINDALPQGASKATLHIQGAAGKYDLATESANTAIAVDSAAKITQPAGTKNYRINTSFLYMGPVNVAIGIAGDIVYGEKVINGVTGKKNAITTLSGDVFGGTGSPNGFNVAIDTAWKAPINQTFP